MPAFSLGKRHIERRLDGMGDVIGAVWVDQYRILKLRSRPGKARQDQYAGIFRILRGDIFLGDEVHSVT